MSTVGRKIPRELIAQQIPMQRVYQAAYAWPLERLGMTRDPFPAMIAVQRVGDFVR